ncbi:MAG: C40 family peptidase [Clostridiaceae bacterium]|jgi:hypothetical protein|nr:C40 family peptidase [Clostridiaceae bacterium]
MSKPVPPFQKGSSSGRSKSSQRTWRSPRQVEHYWTFYKKGLYVSKPSSGMPGWLLPLLAFLVLSALIFWAAPLAVSRLQARHQDNNQTDLTEPAQMYDAATRVVIRPAADVFAAPDLKAGRLSQVLFNEPVTLLPESCPYGYVAVTLQDGLSGYMMEKDLTDATDSVEPAGYAYKAVVVNATKRVMSHARRGTLLVEVMMGTVLYIPYRGSGIAQVALPDGTSGWISDEGVVILPSLDRIKPPYEPRRSFCTSALTFLQATTLAEGQTIDGISMAGIVRLSAAVNGLDLPRYLDGLTGVGQAVETTADEQTGRIDLAVLESADLLILSAPGKPDAEADLAIYLGENQILYARPGQSSVQVMDLSQAGDIWDRIMAVRRLFP